MIILADQMSRNIFRYTKEAYAYDSIAMSVAMPIVDCAEELREYKAFEQIFILTVLEHNENVHLIRRCIQEFEKLRQVWILNVT